MDFNISSSYSFNLFNAACGGTRVVDIVLSVSPSGTRNDTASEMAFYREVLSGVAFKDDQIRVAVTPKRCKGMGRVDGKSGWDLRGLIEKLDGLIEDDSGLADTLHYMRTTSFSESEGARDGAKRLAVLIMNENDSGDMQTALREAFKARIMANIELFVVGVGKNLNPFDLRYMATQPPEQHTFHVINYDELPSLVVRLRNAMCSGS